MESSPQTVKSEVLCDDEGGQTNPDWPGRWASGPGIRPPRLPLSPGEADLSPDFPAHVKIAV